MLRNCRWARCGFKAGLPPDEVIPARLEARARVIAAGLADEDIYRLIDEARAGPRPI
jgi:hypothetical protein